MLQGPVGLVPACSECPKTHKENFHATDTPVPEMSSRVPAQNSLAKVLLEEVPVQPVDSGASERSWFLETRLKQYQERGKRCGHCKELKPIDQFVVHKSKKRPNGLGFDSRCNPCRREYFQKKRYGMTDEEYAVFKEQPVCMICGAAPHKRNGLTCDHDHVTGAIRGAICTPCNFVIGHVDRSPERLERIAAYLRGELAIKPVRE